MWLWLSGRRFWFRLWFPNRLQLRTETKVCSHFVSNSIPDLVLELISTPLRLSVLSRPANGSQTDDMWPKLFRVRRMMPSNTGAVL